jgi:hypothetical protein
MEELLKLSAHKCVLLAAQYATESNIKALRTLTAVRANDLEFGLILRLLLTFLPEAVEPSRYVHYLDELASGSRSLDDQKPTLDTSSIHDITDSQARKRARKLHVLLEPLAHPLYQGETELDPFSHFLIYRSHRIDEETGLLEFIPQLVPPFLHHSEYLRTWFISTVTPLLRIGYEYYPSDPAPSLERFAQLRGRRAVDTLLSHLRPGHGTQPDNREPARDLRGIVGPWICGANDRKRRILDVEDRKVSADLQQTQGLDDWDCLFEWLVHTSKEDLPLICSAFSEWDGPDDMDLGGFDEGQEYLDEEQQARLERKYAQAALATLYLADDSSAETVHTAHSLLARLGNLLGLEAPPDLNVGVDSMPIFDIKSPVSEDCTTSIVQEESLLRPDNPITQPSQEAVRLLELFIFSTHLLSGLQYPISIRDVARMYLRNDHAEQASLVQRILHSLGSGSKKSAGQWKTIRSTLLWLWSWGSTNADGDRHAQGLFGRIEPKAVETEILKAMLENGHSALAIQIYIQSGTGQTPLTPTDVEKALLGSALHYYDNATNGNRTRGGMKRASDIIAAFSPHFPSSSHFKRMQSLLSATHAMSFYSLILQHGVPFQPVNIRVSSDPLALLRKLLSQNRGSYTKLDDLVSIGQNLVISMPSTLLDDDSDDAKLNAETIEKKKAAAERRVIGMAIETALEEDDFETAYSYVVNRLTPPSGSPAASPAASLSSQRFSFGSSDSDKEDDAEDIPWRAALQAGRYGASSVSSSSVWSGSAARPDLRRLEQRMELLSQALLLAPPSHLEEVLAVWQGCEKEMITLLADETEAEERFNEAADQRLPGAFTNDTVAIQPRREVGRGAVEEAPMGLFDVARGAAAAFSKSAFPLRSGSTVSRQDPSEVRDEGRLSMDLGSDEGSMYGNEDRVRRRDMVANAVTGGLASGIGWVLGMYPDSLISRVSTNPRLRCQTH